MLEVREPGVLSTVQDAGRPGFAHLGVPRGGACDRWSLAVANLLLGNAPDAPALEVTFGGLDLVAIETCVVGLAGADLGAAIGAGPGPGEPVDPGAAHLVPAGGHLAFAGGTRGMRAYVAVAGGLDVPRTLGSASTYRTAHLGPFGGRALRAGDRLVPRGRGVLAAAGSLWPEELARGPAALLHDADRGPLPVGLVAGPHLARLGATANALLTETWTVGPASDRMGLRLDGPPLDGPDGAEVMSFGMVPGAVQVPAAGRPIILMADHQTVGGYPVVGVVATVDQPSLGQVRPGDVLRFDRVEVADAQERLRERATQMRHAVARLAGKSAWGTLHLDAGA